MAINNVQTQLQKANEMRDLVQEFAAILTHKMDDIEGKLESSVRAGFPEDIAKHYYEFYFTVDREIVDGLSQKMLSDHVDFLDRVIGNLSHAVEL